MPDLTVIWCRDVPAQVTAGTSRGTTRHEPGERLQDVIDAAAIVGLLRSDQHLARWRRGSRPCHDDVQAEVAAGARRLEQDHGEARLAELARTSGEEQR